MKHKGFLLLLLFSVALASCSSDDEQEQNSVSDNEQEQNSDGRKLRQLTIGEVPITRATLSDHTSTLGASWNMGDQATYFNVSSFSDYIMDGGTLTAASAGSTSKFEGTVRCKKGDMVALFYPAQSITETGTNRGNFTLSLSGQKGTLDDIAERFHYVYGVAEVTSVTESTATATISNMQSLLAVCKFTFTDGTDPIPVKTLTINYYDDNTKSTMGYPLTATLTPTDDVSTLDLTYPSQDTWEDDELTVDLDTETSTGVYFALFPYSPTGYMHFSVTGSSGTYTGTASAKVKAGEYYPFTMKLTKQ